MDLKKIHDWINFVVNKEMSGYFSPEEIDNALDRAQMWLFDILRQRYGISQADQDALGPFKVRMEFTNADTPDGVLSFPQDYQSFLAVMVQVLKDGAIKYLKVPEVNDDELAERLGSYLKPVTVTDPIIQWQGRGEIQFWPRTPTQGVAFYLRRPDEPSFVYTTEGRTVVYDDVSSVQLEWDDPNTEKIMVKALEFLGVNLDDDKLVQYTKS